MATKSVHGTRRHPSPAQAGEAELDEVLRAVGNQAFTSMIRGVGARPGDQQSPLPSAGLTGAAGMLQRLQAGAGNTGVTSLLGSPQDRPAGGRAAAAVTVQRCGDIPSEQCPCHGSDEAGGHAAQPSREDDVSPSMGTTLQRQADVSSEGDDAYSENCGGHLGSCEFYRCRQRNTGNTHPPDGYYLGYGLKYCERFRQKTRPRLSRPGQRWLDKVLYCLQAHLHHNVPDITDPAAAKQSAFDSHPGCYVTGGLCLLPPGDWMVIWDTIDSEDNDLKQMLATGISCYGNWLTIGMGPQHALAVGGGYRGLMERDRWNAFGRRRMTRPFPPRPARAGRPSGR